MNAPSPKIKFFAASAIVIVSSIMAISILFKTDRSALWAENNVEPIISVDTSDERTSQDSDGDGLKDWEEALWGANASMADSDGDGTNDGEEVARNRNPIISGPEDEIIVQGTITGEGEDVNVAEEYVPGSLTDQVGVNLITNLLSLQQHGSLNVQTSESLINAISSDISQLTEVSQLYTAKDTVSFSDKTVEKYKEYGNNLILARNDFIYQISALDSQDPLYIEKSATVFESYAANIMAIPVPLELVISHVAVANATHSLGETFAAMSAASEDPVKGLFMIRNLKKISDQQNQATLSIASFFKLNGIIFSEDEPGYAWTASY